MREEGCPGCKECSLNGWISDDEVRNRFSCFRKLKSMVPHKSLDLQLLKNEGLLFQEWIAHQGLAKFVQIKGDCYLDLVEVFYTNLKVVDGVIHSRVKGVNIIIDDDVQLSFTGLKAEGYMSHVHDSEVNKWTNKMEIYKDCLRYPGRTSSPSLYCNSPSPSPITFQNRRNVPGDVSVILIRTESGTELIKWKLLSET
ncbi:hypothetical protein LR48_Vigan11g059100 [Vigna angularis]|uniref:Uncharacterized protein n=1 Tax=Phaseolus angularis TaxID=3914 RepID=A0A0L9VRI6_PHAAN|nr:hypothetical protein LR48_Vigan11g059100 [Vigna angularis]